MNERRKADVDPFWAICAGLLLVTFAVVVFFLVTAPAYAQERTPAPEGCEYVSDYITHLMDKDKSAVVHLISEEKELQRAMEWVKTDGGKPPEGIDRIFHVTTTGESTIIFVKDGLACYKAIGPVNHGKEFWNHVKFVPEGRPA